MGYSGSNMNYKGKTDLRVSVLEFALKEIFDSYAKLPVNQSFRADVGMSIALQNLLNTIKQLREDKSVL